MEVSRKKMSLLRISPSSPGSDVALVVLTTEEKHTQAHT